MLELACANDSALDVSDLELQRDGVSYSVDTLAYLRAQEPATDFIFILGHDALLGLPKWERWQELLTDNLLAVVSREASQVPPERFVKVLFVEKLIPSMLY